MKRTVTITGYGHIEGTTKANKDYSFIEISGTCCDERYAEGVKAVSFAVFDPAELEGIDLTIGNKIHVWSHFYQGKDYVDAIMQA